jgi:hypothetical protein
MIGNIRDKVLPKISSPDQKKLTLSFSLLRLAAKTVQSLASPAYLHYIATTTTSEGQSLLLDSKFKAFLRYLHNTWSKPEYSRFIVYPNSLYFLEVLINNDAFCRELAQVGFRNFCHQVSVIPILVMVPF